MKKLISVIVPVYNEEENIVNLHAAVSKVFDTIADRYELEILYMDNRSRDKSFPLIEDLNRKDSRVRGIRYSRNFGYQRSIYCGYLEARGEAIVQLDCDLQDDPALIPRFLEEWEKGHEIVFGVRRKREEPFLMELTRKAFYRILNRISDTPIPNDVGEFRLVDKKIVAHLREMHDHQPYLRGIIASLGYEPAFVEYDRKERKLGKSKFDMRALFKVAFDGIFDYSVVPLRLASYFGFILSGLIALLAVYYILGKFFFFKELPPGFTTITLLVLFGISINAIFLGIIGEYIGRIYRQLKKEPVAIVDKRVGN